MLPSFVQSIDYGMQYSEMYRSRSKIIGDSIEAFANRKGYTKTNVPQEGKEQLLIGCIYIAVERPKYISTLHNIMLPDREMEVKKQYNDHKKDHRKSPKKGHRKTSTVKNSSVPEKEGSEENNGSDSQIDPASCESQIIQEKEWDVVKPEYYIEDTGLERTHLILDKAYAHSLMHGMVVGVIGEFRDLSFAVSDIILPIQAIGKSKKREEPEKKKICTDSPGSNSNTCNTPDSALECIELKDVEAMMIVADPDMASDTEVTAVIDLVTGLDARCKPGLVVLGGQSKEEKDKKDKKEEKGKTEKLKRITSVLDGSSTVFIPGPGDDVPYMLPLIPPPREILGISDNCQVLSNPCFIRASGFQMVFCDPISVREIQRYVGKNKIPDLEDYFSAMQYMITAMHISPCAPDSCPVYPLSCPDPFILQAVPDFIVSTSSSKASGIRTFEAYGHVVTMCVVPMPRFGILKVEKGVAEIINLNVTE